MRSQIIYQCTLVAFVAMQRDAIIHTTVTARNDEIRHYLLTIASELLACVRMVAHGSALKAVWFTIAGMRCASNALLVVSLFVTQGMAADAHLLSPLLLAHALAAALADLASFCPRLLLRLEPQLLFPALSRILAFFLGVLADGQAHGF